MFRVTRYDGVGLIGLLWGVGAGFATDASFYYRPLAGAPNAATSAAAINAQGAIAGNTGNWGNGMHAFLSDASGELDTIDDGTGFFHTDATVMNDAGQVAGRGSRKLSGNQWLNSVFRYTPGVGVQDLGKFSGNTGTVHDMNSVGELTGYWYVGVSSPAARAFLYTDAGGLQNLGTLGGSDSFGNAINDVQQVVGYSYTASDQSRAFLWENGTMMNLGTLGGGFSEAVDINNAGVVVGSASLANGAYRAFRWDAIDEMQALPMPTGTTNSHAVAVTESGYVLGLFARSVPFESRTFRWSASEGTIELPTFDNTMALHPVAINELGHVVGFSHDEVYETIPFLWTPEGGLVNLLEAISPPLTWWGIQPVAINVAGEILVRGWDDNSLDQTAILVPLLRGDLDCDKDVDFGDINPFVLAMTNVAGYESAYPACFREGADMDANGVVDFGDINLFVAALTTD